ncbi:MAG: hypothetical protein WDO18_05475 [Acidobacteriota bacterium]
MGGGGGGGGGATEIAPPMTPPGIPRRGRRWRNLSRDSTRNADSFTGIDHDILHQDGSAFGNGHRRDEAGGGEGSNDVERASRWRLLRRFAPRVEAAAGEGGGGATNNSRVN